CNQASVGSALGRGQVDRGGVDLHDPGGGGGRSDLLLVARPDLLSRPATGVRVAQPARVRCVSRLTARTPAGAWARWTTATLAGRRYGSCAGRARRTHPGAIGSTASSTPGSTGRWVHSAVPPTTS